MPKFTSVREAKEFLVSRIAEESQREGISLSEVEEKMLYFSETAWTLPDIWEVNEAFDRDYDQAEYEDKIVGLIRGFRKFARQHRSADLEAWDDAVQMLRTEDHYLLVMVDIEASVLGVGRLPEEATSTDLLVFIVRTVLIGLAVLIVCFALLMIYSRLRY